MPCTRAPQSSWPVGTTPPPLGLRTSPFPRKQGSDRFQEPPRRMEALGWRGRLQGSWFKGQSSSKSVTVGWTSTGETDSATLSDALSPSPRSPLLGCQGDVIYGDYQALSLIQAFFNSVLLHFLRGRSAASVDSAFWMRQSRVRDTVGRWGRESMPLDHSNAATLHHAGRGG